MKRMAYSGTYKIQPDDFLVFDGDTDSVITERELLEEQKMNNYFMLDGKKIPMSDETAKSLQKEQETYKIGDCFKVGTGGTIIMLAICNSNPTKVVPVCLDSGNWWSVSKTVNNAYAITPAELHSLFTSRNGVYIPITIKIEELE